MLLCIGMCTDLTSLRQERAATGHGPGRHSLENTGRCLERCAASTACRSADCSMAAFHTATYSRPSATV